MDDKGKAQLVRISVLLVGGLIIPAFIFLGDEDASLDGVLAWVITLTAIVGGAALVTWAKRRGVSRGRRTLYAMGIASVAALLVWVVVRI